MPSIPAPAGRTNAATKTSELGGSSSAPVLANSPYAAVLPRRDGRKGKKKAWQPPPGAFNHPDLPHFDRPGPGRYTPSVGLTKPRPQSARFGSEDRFKYLGPQQSLEATAGGMIGGYQPQSAASPGPGYLPSYGLVHTSSRVSSFTVERRDTSGIGAGSGAAVNPGPGLYTPSEKVLSTRRDNTPGGAFLADDRHKYLGQVDGESGTVRISQGPGPQYNPSDRLTKPRGATVAFGGHGPGTIRKPPSLKGESPGPGAYEHAVTLGDGAKLSNRPRSAAAGFGSTQRGNSAFVDSAQCWAGKVPVDMSHANATDVSPGPGYLPSYKQVKPEPQQAVFGTAKRVTRSQGLARWAR